MSTSTSCARVPDREPVRFENVCHTFKVHLGHGLDDGEQYTVRSLPFGNKGQWVLMLRFARSVPQAFGGGNSCTAVLDLRDTAFELRVKNAIVRWTIGSEAIRPDTYHSVRDVDDVFVAHPHTPQRGGFLTWQKSFAVFPQDMAVVVEFECAEVVPRPAARSVLELTTPAVSGLEFIFGAVSFAEGYPINRREGLRSKPRPYLKGKLPRP